MATVIALRLTRFLGAPLAGNGRPPAPHFRKRAQEIRQLLSSSPAEADAEEASYQAKLGTAP